VLAIMFQRKPLELLCDMAKFQVIGMISVMFLIVQIDVLSKGMGKFVFTK